MSFVSRDEFLQSNGRPHEDVPLPAPLEGKVIRVYGMTARERTEFELSFQSKKGTPIEARRRELRERLVVACCRDAHGEPLFQPQDVQALGGKSSRLLEPIVNAAQRLCGMTGEDLEELAKNSDATPDADSP